MRTALIDVTYEIEVGDDELQHLSDPNFHRAAMERMRDKASVIAREAGGYVRTDRAPEISIPRVAESTSPVLGHKSFVLYASRWHVEVPESFHGDGR